MIQYIVRYISMQSDISSIHVRNLLMSPKDVSRHIDFHRVFDYIPGFGQVFPYTLQITIFEGSN